MATGTVRQMSLGRELFLPGMTIQAMRDSRYRHPANAVAELIDNSIDAKASRVELLIRERQELVVTRHSWKVDELAVIDNGHGMSDETLVQALRFGGRQSPQSIRPIGKYGMGLPTASVSQCRKVDVWTWQESVDQKSHSYIDLEAIEKGEQCQIPEPDDKSIPEWLRSVSQEVLDQNHGTIVVWSNIDRIKAQVETIFKRVEKDVGRIYRHFINDDELTIRIASFRDDHSTAQEDRYVRPNDPLYLMRNTSTPKPWREEPMFASTQPTNKEVLVDGRPELVEIIYSVVKREALGEQAANPGSLPHGQDARHNMGVSVVRENREILLDNSFVREGGRGSIPMNRWWGCEVRFGSGCDDLFGVDHNKQVVVTFSNAAKELLNSEGDTQNVLEGVENDDIYRIVDDIRKTTNSLSENIDLLFKQRRSARKRRSNEPPAIHDEAAELAETASRDAGERGDEPPTRTSQERNQLNEQARKDNLEESLKDSGFPEEDAKRLAADWIQNKRWYAFTSAQLSGGQMFSVHNENTGVLNVKLNIHHPVYEFLRVIEEEAEESGNKVARRAALGIITMLLSWGSMENQIINPERRSRVQDVAIDWGRQVSEVLRLLNERSVY